ncbi:hypothetical protein SKAU_G00249940 [Synaphobranchus kaupii]|uniref:Integrase catalytic domain-containing protein n=1 Tax=Synaphobranchus kaupii TaxID=118154 RepID=A0A9Q1IPP5_SYNKA|nr:hypothetical protein SKAU_G00249940 [Synaphobranchus kaupii]
MPVVHGCRNIPLSVIDKLKDTLQDLEKRDVITAVKEPTEWVNSLVITEKKNGTLRVCLDPCDLSKAVKRQHIPTPEDVRSKLAGKSIFTILDEKDGYWQIKLDEPSSKLCTFNIPWGRFRFLRLPFGIKSASEVFQQKNCETFGHIPGVHIIAEDMIIAASSDQENADLTTQEGQRPNDAKVKAINDMPPPEDKQGLQRLLGMTKYLAQYIQNEASLTAPLRQLLRKDAMWQWSPHHSAALKATLTRAPVLWFYDHKKPLTIQADSSKDGLGACLLQEGQPLCYASRTLTETEQRYAQIEKELLAIVFSAKIFNQYIYGKTVTVQSDHKPLEIIVQKQLSKAPARLQRMPLQVQRHGIPKELVSDNVPFAIYEMKSFAASWEFKLTHSSLGYPQSNGLSERARKTVKHALKKALQTGTDPHLVLLSLRNTPVIGLNEYPAHMLMGSVLRSTFPCYSAVLQQSTPQHVHSRLQDLQSRQQRYYNRDAKPLP